MSNDYVVYIHKNEANDVKYVGMGKKTRPSETKKRSEKWMSYFKHKKFYPEILYSNLSEEEALEKEKELYYFYKNKGYSLLNSYRGIGFGGNTYKNKTEEEMNEIKRKISKGNSGENNGNKGQYIGKLNSMYGKESPSRKIYTIKNIQTEEFITIDSRSKLVEYLKQYRYFKYKDRNKRKNLGHEISTANINEFCMGRLTSIDDFILINMELKNKKV